MERFRSDRVLGSAVSEVRPACFSSVAAMRRRATHETQFLVQRTAHTGKPLTEDVRVNLCSPQILMTKQFLHGTDVAASTQQLRSEGTPERVATDGFIEGHAPCRRPYCLLHTAGMNVMLHNRPTFIAAEAYGRK